MEDLKGSTVVITGASSGIGLHTAKQLHSRGATVIMTCRDEVKGRKSLAEIITANGNDVQRAHLYTLNLASYQSVHDFANEIIRDFDHLDVLINNAGIMGHEYELSEDGIEMHYATNAFGHHILSLRLLPLLLKSVWARGPRIINVTSGFYRKVDRKISAKELRGEKFYNYKHQMAYAQSKLAVCNHTVALDRLLKVKGVPVKIHAVRPGFVRGTDLGRESHWLLRLLAAPIIWFFSKSLDQGIATIVDLVSVNNTEVEGGLLYYEGKPEPFNTDTVNVNEARDTWAIFMDLEQKIWESRTFLLPEATKALGREARQFLPESLWSRVHDESFSV